MMYSSLFFYHVTIYQVYEPPGCLVSYRIVRRFVKKNMLLILHHMVLVFLVYPAVLFARNDEVS